MKILAFIGFAFCVMLVACAGERQGLVCEEMEYRLNTMAYSPDQRAYAEEELRVCREEEALKKADGAASRKSIYDRFAATDSTNSSRNQNGTGADQDISVSDALKDSSGQETVSIYDRYGSKSGDGNDGMPDVPSDTSASDASDFQ